VVGNVEMNVTGRESVQNEGRGRITRRTVEIGAALSLICESNLLLAERWPYVPGKMLSKMQSSGT
jgi:hypothetical protein